MSQTLRPLSVGELLDRTFSYYRRHFVVFFGIAVLPNLLVFAFQVAGMLAVRAAGAFLTTNLKTNITTTTGRKEPWNAGHFSS